MELQISENIKRMRKNRAMTQEQLAEALGVTVGAVYKWENGLSTPEIRMLVETIRAIFDRPEVRVALPGLIADTVADPELHESMLARLTVGLDAFEARSGRSRRDGDLLPVLVEVVAGSAIFRLLIRRDASLDEDWVEEMTRLLAGHPAHTGL